MPGCELSQCRQIGCQDLADLKRGLQHWHCCTHADVQLQFEDCPYASGRCYAGQLCFVGHACHACRLLSNTWPLGIEPCQCTASHISTAARSNVWCAQRDQPSHTLMSTSWQSTNPQTRCHMWLICQTTSRHQVGLHVQSISDKSPCKPPFLQSGRSGPPDHSCLPCRPCLQQLELAAGTIGNLKQDKCIVSYV